MREILFSGKQAWNDEWAESEYPFGTIHCGAVVHDFIPETVGQYTGLTDKNGKKIFEGDIGRYKQTDGAKENGKPIICTGVVLYNEKTASFAVESKDGKGRKYFDYFPIKDFEIIGNIHDTPELLKGE